MTILVAYASKHGSTQGIAGRIADTLEKMGKEAVLRQIDGDVGHLEAYEAFVIGSAIYAGSWMREATEFVRHNREVLAGRPTWLFSSGPLGTEVKDTEQQPREIAEIEREIHPRDHRIFFGALDPNSLTFVDRMIVKAVRAPTGDFRNWDAIEAWAEDIARALTPGAAAPGATPSDASE
jgi:menaquinone-dependent protoporphyrinogen oxidase